MNTDPFIHQSASEGQPAIEACRLPVSNHFPPSIRDALVAASRVWPTPGDPMARVRAIAHATELAQSRYPELFRNDY